jgi:hypothetical protein
MRIGVWFVLSIAAAGFFAGTSHAQFQSPFGGGGFGGGFGSGFGSQINRPTVSPYLNIARGGDPAINYYGLVRPQIAFGRAFQNVENNVTALQADAGQPSQTGQRSSFMTQSRYFMNNYSSGARLPQMQQQQQPQQRRR